MKDDVIRIAHISDLHFGAKGYKEVIGSLAQHLRLRVRPHLLLVTGDLVDTPRKALITEVYEWLETLNQGLGWEPGQLPRYLVCPGNHDRHKRGNALPWRRPKYRFEKRFKANKSDDPFSHWLGEEPHRWRVRVVSVDSSVRARYSAQAFLGESDLKPVRELKEWNDDEEPPYLVIMLIHHHLLPLPASEREVQSAWDLFKLTSAVNPGRILESLSASYVDVVLHGHEHKRNIARYGSYRKDSNQIVIAAAASATGAETLKGCDSARASFNVLELRPDRSVWVTEVHGPSGNHNDWHDASTIQILDSTTLRHNRFLRSLYRWRKVRQAGPEPLAGAGHQSEWRKHVIFTAGRDAIVREHRTDWQITDGEFSFRIQNDTGQPARPAAEFKLTSASGNPNTPRISPKSGERGAFFFRVDMGTKAPVSAALIETAYQWVDGILLTEDDFELIDMNNSGPFRGLRQEFVAASVLRPLRELCLSVTFPVGFYPDEEQVEVDCQRLPSGAIVRDEALEARRQFTGQTVILTVPYPLMDYRYVIAWRPVAGRLSTAAMTDLPGQVHGDGPRRSLGEVIHRRGRELLVGEGLHGRSLHAAAR